MNVWQCYYSSVVVCIFSIIQLLAFDKCDGLSSNTNRRTALGWLGGACTGLICRTAPSTWSANAVQDSLDVNNFLRTGIDLGGVMGVSSQAGKSRPVTGVYLRDGSEVSRNSKSGDVLAEIILRTKDGGSMAALTTYTSSYPLAKGSYYDVECRDAKTGDGVFLQVTTNVGGKSISELSDSFFLDNLLASTGRFSLYGSPTDVRVQKSETKDGRRIIDFRFSTLLQSTQSEIPRKAQLVATLPPGSSQAVMMVGSATASRWKKGVNQEIIHTMDSFQAIPAPQTSMKLRRKDRGQSISFD